MDKRVEQIRFQRQFSRERGSGDNPTPPEIAIDDLLSEIDRQGQQLQEAEEEINRLHRQLEAVMDEMGHDPA